MHEMIRMNTVHDQRTVKGQTGQIHAEHAVITALAMRTKTEEEAEMKIEEDQGKKTPLIATKKGQGKAQSLRTYQQ